VSFVGGTLIPIYIPTHISTHHEPHLADRLDGIHHLLFSPCASCYVLPSIMLMPLRARCSGCSWDGLLLTFTLNMTIIRKQGMLDTCLTLGSGATGFPGVRLAWPNSHVVLLSSLYDHLNQPEAADSMVLYQVSTKCCMRVCGGCQPWMLTSTAISVLACSTVAKLGISGRFGSHLGATSGYFGVNAVCRAWSGPCPKLRRADVGATPRSSGGR
jgi:hypothetical protein